MQALQQSPKPFSIFEQHGKLLVEFQRFLQRCGIEKTAWTEEGLAHFRALPEAEQIKNFHQLRDYLALCLELEKEGIEALRNPRRLLRALAFRLRLVLPEDFLDRLTGDEVVEIYDFQGIQLYRNLTFFEVSDYTLDDFFGRPWDSLFERPSAINKALHEVIEKMAKARKCLPMGVPEHFLRERFTKNRKVIKLKFGHIAPLLRGEEMVAFIVSCNALGVLPRVKESEALHFL